MSSERYLKYEKPRREWYIKHGICRQCGQRPAASGRKKCMICLQKERQYKKQKNSQRHIPQELRGNGVYCYLCCQPKCNGEKLCAECYAKVNRNLSKVKRDTSNHIWRKQEQARIAEVKYKHGW